MRNLYSILIIFLSCLNSNAQTFNLSDSTFNKGDFHRTYNVNFEIGKWDIRPESNEYLNGIITFLNRNPNLIIEVRVHRDSRGSKYSSTCLTCKRAKSVTDYLVGKGIVIDRLLSRGYGDDVPVTYYDVDSKTDDTLSIHILKEKYINQFRKVNQKKYQQLHQLNRRVEFVIFSANYQPPPPPIKFKYELSYNEKDSLSLTAKCEIYNNTNDTLFFESQTCNGLQEYLSYDPNIVSGDFIYCHLSIPIRMSILPNSKYSFNSLLSTKVIVKQIKIDLRFVQLIDENQKVSKLVGEQIVLP